MHQRAVPLEARWATSVQAARYVGRSRQWLIDRIGPYLHEVRIGGERMYDLREIDDVLRAMATEPLVGTPDAPARSTDIAPGAGPRETGP